MDIKLNFINQSNDVNNSEVVIFQKNVATDTEGLAVAWLVIKNCGMGDNYPFSFPMKAVAIGASDSSDTYTPQLTAQNGQAFQVCSTPSGTAIAPMEPSAAPTQVELQNNLSTGAINASIYKAGKLLATKTSLESGQKAAFEFKPTIWIGVAPQIEEGSTMNSAILSNINTELSLLGVSSADIVMTGGGPGANSQPYAFNLDNVVMA